MIYEIYYPFTFLNEYINLERRNKFMASNVKRDTTSAVRYMLLNKEKIQTPCGLKFTWFVHDRKRDLDNITFAKKYILDGMVKAEIIPNDNLMHITNFIDVVEITPGMPIGVRIEVIE